MEGIALEDYIKTQKSKNKRIPNRPVQSSKRPDSSHAHSKTKRTISPPSETPKTWKKQLIVVENLPLNFQNSDLKNLFSKFGELTRCNVLFDIKGDSKVV